MNVETFSFGGKHTPEQTLISALNNDDDKQCVVIVYLDRDGYVKTVWSDGSMLGRIGMLDVAKTQMLEAAQEGE